MTRRVVTGVDGNGRSRIISDEVIAPKSIIITPEIYQIWGSDKPVVVPNDGKLPSYRNMFPPERGFRMFITEIQPDAVVRAAEFDPAEFERRVREVFPGLMDSHEPDKPGMHATQTVDIGIILSGEIWLKLDDGEEILLREGDVSIQNGNRHAWRNRSEASCRIAWTLVGAGPVD